MTNPSNPIETVQALVDALEHVTTSETFYRDPRGDRAGPAIDAGRALLAQMQSQPSDEREAFEAWYMKWAVESKTWEPTRERLFAAWQAARALGPVKAQQEPVAYCDFTALRLFKSGHINSLLLAREVDHDLNHPLYEKATPAAHQGAQPAVPTEIQAEFSAMHELLEWNRAPPEPLVKVAYEYGVFRKAIELYRRALAAAPSASAQPYKDSTPALRVGDSSFESWYEQHPKATTGDKQLARDAYAAGMGDPLVTYAAQEPQGEAQQPSVRPPSDNLEWLLGPMEQVEQQQESRKPLTDVERLSMFYRVQDKYSTTDMVSFLRGIDALEAHHGICTGASKEVNDEA